MAETFPEPMVKRLRNVWGGEEKGYQYHSVSKRVECNQKLRWNPRNMGIEGTVESGRKRTLIGEKTS